MNSGVGGFGKNGRKIYSDLFRGYKFREMASLVPHVVLLYYRLTMKTPGMIKYQKQTQEKTGVENNWASALASSYEPLVENSLLSKTGDMTTFLN
ncbi:hypothetical protein Tco_0305850, partial [Tanacetum coccineum]